MISLKEFIGKFTHPIGSIYTSVDSTSPADLFGGTWERFGKGKALVGVDENDTDFNTVEKTGGEKKHTLTVAEMPSHNHSFEMHYSAGSAAKYNVQSNLQEKWTNKSTSNTGGWFTQQSPTLCHCLYVEADCLTPELGVRHDFFERVHRKIHAPRWKYLFKYRQYLPC